MKRRLAVVLALLLLVAPLAPAQTTRPFAAIDHVLIISIDGLRPDCMLRADAPTLRAMLDRGSFSLWARTTVASVTLPSHVSMLTGVRPEVHTIVWNAEMPFKNPIYPASPTIFELAKAAGYSTAMISGKAKFEIFNKPGALDDYFVPTRDMSDDDAVAAKAVPVILEHRPDVMFVHLPGPDWFGHKIGWGTPEQIAGIAKSDHALKTLFDAYDKAGLTSHTLVIVSADHGGTAKGHGSEDTRSRMIPWLAAGPGVRAGYDLTLLGRDFDVQTFDTFATACYVMGIDVKKKIDGKPIREMFVGNELLTSAPTPPATSRASLPTEPAEATATKAATQP